MESSISSLSITKETSTYHIVSMELSISICDVSTPNNNILP